MEMLTILCVKVGTKYPSSMVNNLFRMCRKNITRPFEMFCYTDNPEGISHNINIIDYIENGLDIVVYNKMFLFSKQVNDQLPRGDRIFFDLDIVIKHDINDIATFNHNELTLIEAEWRQKWDYGFPVFHHPFNSSCMTWQENKPQKIWEFVSKDPESYMNKYRWGMDSFLFYEKENINVNIGYFPTRKFYSFLYGVDFEENALYDPVQKAYRESKFVETVKKIPVILFNGPTLPEHYIHHFQKYYAD